MLSIKKWYVFRRNEFSIRKDDWKKFEKHNITIALNFLNNKKEKIYPVYVSKHN